MNSAFGRGTEDLHLPDCAFDQECALRAWCLLEEFSLLFTIPLENVAFQKEAAFSVLCCWFASVVPLEGMVLFKANSFL